MTRALASVSVRHDAKRAVAEIQGLRADIEEKATVRALNYVLNKVATETGREIRKVYNVKLKAITAAMKKHRANRKHLTSRLVVEGVRLGLIEFAARAVNPWNVKGRRHRTRGGGVSVQIKVAGGRKLIRGAFITAATRNNATGGGSAGMRQVFHRDGADRDSFRSLKSISVPQAFANQAVVGTLRRLAVERFNYEFRRQLSVLGGTGGR